MTKVYPPHTLLPSEKQLIDIYGASRETIRKALNLLRSTGYIQKKQGKGSINRRKEEIMMKKEVDHGVSHQIIKNICSKTLIETQKTIKKISNIKKYSFSVPMATE